MAHIFLKILCSEPSGTIKKLHLKFYRGTFPKCLKNILFKFAAKKNHQSSYEKSRHASLPPHSKEKKRIQRYYFVQPLPTNKSKNKNHISIRLLWEINRMFPNIKHNDLLMCVAQRKESKTVHISNHFQPRKKLQIE